MKLKRKTTTDSHKKRINNRMFLRSGQETLNIIQMFYSRLTHSVQSAFIKVNRLYAVRHVTKPEDGFHRIRLSEKVLTAVRTDYDIYGYLR